VLATVAVSLGWLILLLWISGQCQNELTSQWPNQRCDGVSGCVEYISTYMVMCKYSGEGLEWTMWLMFYTVLVVVLTLHAFVCSIASKGSPPPAMRYLIHTLTALAAIGISLVVSFDHQDIAGMYTYHYEILVVSGYSASPVSLHGLGVVLLFGSGAGVHAILLWQYSMIQSQYRLMYDISWDIALECGTELLYVGTMTAFFVFFLLNAVATAIMLEYITLALYVALFIVAIWTTVDVVEKIPS